MNDDLIRRDETINVIQLYARVAGGEVALKYADMFQCAINGLPSADRPKGEWEHYMSDKWFCSECGHGIFTEGSWEHPLEKGKFYCENCGADMRGEDDDI